MRVFEWRCWKCRQLLMDTDKTSYIKRVNKHREKCGITPVGKTGITKSLKSLSVPRVYGASPYWERRRNNGG